MTTRRGCRAQGTWRTVSSGSSRSTVPMPVSIAHDRARSACTSRRDASLDDPAAFAVGERDAPVERGRGLDAHPRPAARHAREEPAVGLRGRLGQEARFHADAGLPQPREAASLHQRVGILERGDHAADARGHQRVGAGGRAAVVAAGLEGQVDGRALGRLAAGGERCRLGVRLAGARVPALAQHPAALRDDATHARVGRGGVAAARGERQGARHQGMILGGEAHPTCPAPRGSRRGSPRRPRSCGRRRRSGCRPPCRACAAPPSPSRRGAASRPRARPGRGASARCA